MSCGPLIYLCDPCRPESTFVFAPCDSPSATLVIVFFSRLSLTLSAHWIRWSYCGSGRIEQLRRPLMTCLTGSRLARARFVLPRAAMALSVTLPRRPPPLLPPPVTGPPMRPGVQLSRRRATRRPTSRRLAPFLVTMASSHLMASALSLPRPPARLPCLRLRSRSRRRTTVYSRHDLTFRLVHCSKPCPPLTDQAEVACLPAALAPRSSVGAATSRLPASEPHIRRHWSPDSDTAMAPTPACLSPRLRFPQVKTARASVQCPA